jgi:hypothetical protein
MFWRRREPCDHPEPRQIVVQVVITDAAGNVRAVREAEAYIACEHFERENVI